MANRIPKEIIEDILERVDIVQVIEAHLPLKKVGNNYTRCCPFHDEKTPSFSVNQKQQFYHCFGCKASGNAITFLMEYLGLDFISAVEELGSLCGVKISKEDNPVQKSKSRHLNETINFATVYYEQQLRRSESRQKAIDYLKGRGISGESAKIFRIGYAPEGWKNLVNAHRNQGLNNIHLKETGLVAEGKNNIYDRFRERIIFPIRNRRGSVIGFGGRSIGEQQPKYLNSPETQLFQKGHELYGLFETLNYSRPKQIFVVEGYLDVISLYQAGIKNTVATLGTAISKIQIEKLFKETAKIQFCFDGDLAGQTAARKALDLSLPLLKNDRQIEFSFLPNGSDPDSLIRAFGANQFLNQCRTISLVDFLLEVIAEKSSSSTNSSNAASAALAKPLILSIPDATQRAFAVNALAEKTGFDPAILWREFNLNLKKQKTRDIRQNLSEFSSRPLVEQLIAILIFAPDAAKFMNQDTKELIASGIDSSDHFLRVWELARRSGQNRGILYQNLRDLEDFSKIEYLLSIELPYSESEAKKEFKDGIKKLKMKSQENIIKRFNTLPLSEWTEEQKRLVREYKHPSDIESFEK